MSPVVTHSHVRGSVLSSNSLNVEQPVRSNQTGTLTDETDDQGLSVPEDA